MIKYALRRVVSKQEINKFVEDNNIEFFMETSAINGLNTKELFINTGKLLYKDYLNYSKNPTKSMFSRASVEKSLKDSNQIEMTKHTDSGKESKGCC